MDVVLGVYSCIAQDRDHAEKEKRWSQTRCVNSSKRGHNRVILMTHTSFFESVRYARQLGIVERAIIDGHSNVISPSDCWEWRSLRKEYSVSPSGPLDSELMPTNNRSTFETAHYISAAILLPEYTSLS